MGKYEMKSTANDFIRKFKVLVGMKRLTIFDNFRNPCVKSTLNNIPAECRKI